MSDYKGYLAYYRSTLSTHKPRLIGGFFRSLLDAKAQKMGQSSRHALFLDRVLSLCSKGNSGDITVLEVGPGDGWALSLHRSGLRRIGIDQGDDFACTLKEKGIEFYRVNIETESLPLEDKTVDVIMMNHVIEHLADPLLFLKEAKRTLRPGGCLYVRTPNIRRVGTAFWEDYTHVRPYTPASLRAMAEAHGLTHMFTFASDHGRINLDILTEGRLRTFLLAPWARGAEIEACFRLGSP
ncbi:class I SAM-dependent methyltransferase [Haematospirillum jordaniae]|uniref:Uncharacterized protein n=1 Tax=Haematospirillum jordaniae TaxID=1549855 RepID=A0A143DD17_9PROT|nr:class I SAM-dependent methyltransferase [Haematospirillum jordaniae]AMW34566.1 hypothetical protein AY555_04515 [Haematospirillum jordaniae]NKD46334.1 class I SAM-dependent methyltransferase [Haematospirillum jordaniae]NKD58159.1 class I SAM-dependent methyltransferase [Haematospirillum jordaniae]NKD60269.1 class I SAM-dependent methyltransferase [Haematospirillum jordaniae]NKD68207.1 class I SAM-dependent methyltransferase [Haematospirillum jordaniae]